MDVALAASISVKVCPDLFKLISHIRSRVLTLDRLLERSA
jgi:hypothetical protein